MADREPLDLVHEHYELGQERDRLATPFGQVEFARTTEVVLRHVPSPPAAVADIGGGPGRYSLWLAERGYTVVHRDPVALHVEQLTAAAGALGGGIRAAVGDARALDLDDACMDAVVDLVSLEGIAFALPDLERRLADPAARRVVLDTARALERVPELLGIGPHLLATARRCQDRPGLHD